MNGIIPYRTHIDSLRNGLKVVRMPMPGNGLVAYWTLVRTGSRDEYEPGRTGFAHFFEHMMFRGTKKYPSEEYNRVVSEMGADANAYTTDDYTCYTMVIPTAQLETAMDLESDRFQNLSYEEPPFRTEAGAVYGEYRKNLSNPFSIAN
ncbi:MAG: insulinase family protein, partial [Gammaproteobacteria bacterium]